MPPPGGIAGRRRSLRGSSATIASVVISSAATEAAFWIACARPGRVDDALLDEVANIRRFAVEAVSVRLVLEDLCDDHGNRLHRIDRDLAPARRAPAHDLDAGLLVVVLGAQALELLEARSRRRRRRDDAIPRQPRGSACIAS